MQRYSIDEAITHLPQLIEEARQGETILILDEGGKAVQLVPVTSAQRRRQAGSARGQVTMSEDFDAPLTDFDEV